MEDFNDLRVWQKAPELTLAVYRKSAAFPKEEMYGSFAERRCRSERSVPRDADAGQIQKCGSSCKSRDSANEVECHLLLAGDLRFLPLDDFKNLEGMVLEIQRMLASLVQRLSMTVVARSQ
jgi:four helix bundle protein